MSDNRLTDVALKRLADAEIERDRLREIEVASHGPKKLREENARLSELAQSVDVVVNENTELRTALDAESRLARRVYATLMALRDQVLRYTVPPDARYIAALNAVDRLMQDHDAVLSEDGPR
jgi:hypothetical protein